MKLNELEFINGLIYANIYTTNLVAVIDPEYGKVMAIIDATELVRRGKGTANGEVLNGIAYNSANRKTYMTGKFWPKLFEIDSSGIVLSIICSDFKKGSSENSC